MQYDLVISDGTVVTARGYQVTDIGVLGEQIAAIGSPLSGKKEIDARGKLVAPGAVDIHVHLQMPIGNFVSSDDFYTGTRAAAFGGTTTIVDFVEPDVQESMLDALAARRALADPRVAVDYGLHMTIGPAEIEKLDQLPEVVQAGCLSFKLYMAYGLCLTDDQLMVALEAVRDVDGLPVIHTENWPVIKALVARNLAAGRRDPSWHPGSRPAIMEGEAAGRAIDIAYLVGSRLHIFHITCGEVVDRIISARLKGLQVSGETCPQYQLLTEEVYSRPGLEGALPVCSPPIRGRDEQDRLWRALSDGDIQVISTDHCPFRKEEKASGLEDFSRIPGGVPSIEMRFPGIYSFGVLKGHISASQWVDLCCTTPARLAGLKGKGDIAVGYDADIVIFDTERQVDLSTKTLHENVDWTPYKGQIVQGWPEMTISRGEVIVEHGRFLGQAGRGKYVARSFDGD